MLTFAMLFNSIFEGGATPKPIFFSTEMWWQARVLSEWLRFFLRPGKGSPPKSRPNTAVNIENPELGAKEPICCKLQTARSPRSERVVRSDFGSESIGDQSFGFSCLLYAICKLFWSKTLIGLLERSNCSAMVLDSFSWFRDRSFLLHCALLWETFRID